ncbi:MAG: LpxL/LpxP family Kdo(2)-lipid IV(A) lauroyl/palmitoleoyl acyltransferase [Oceanospirillaceae bacterium]|jgi:KDO2-lipid IV(A) lauroyltransferase|nr:LpxL/LpxP family Kdo(2)-lipid IV(A) lauroyl/palmitoleoyl acyltransferase [Oceanospirillaceae bacterium]MBT6076705.1 LpxL/LpxP family Kdo(2)-lipid IV(A) lauroyl/palmitoleoyl acyltransferase [Oceanospirillaceae bacterium]MBT7330938.1 LpxL/LpxP family Kdo(2)-lipid IV(A) lauroyl/palmitoleoyl acyltransferase [Oceanospirillaceae bacterium]
MPNPKTPSDLPSLSRFYGPKYWLIWLGLACLRITIVLPWRWRMAVGRAIGWLLYQLSARRRVIAETNINLCFPHLRPSQKNHLVQATFADNGVGIIETAMAWWSSRQTFNQRVSVTGSELIEQAQSEGRGVLLVGAHYTSLDLGGILLAPSHPYYATYQRHGNALMDTIIRGGRLRHLPGMVERDDIRQVMRLLKQGKTVWLAPDQDVGPERSVFAPFFGVDAATTPIISRLAQATGAKVLQFSHHRINQDANYLLTISDTLASIPSGNIEQDTACLNAAIEAQVANYPSQYLWLHRRFKTRPANSPSIY